MADERSRVLTLVFTDLADSTALKSERGDQAVRDLILRHREHVTRLAEECAGRVIDWAGDGCFLTFETSTAGVMFSLRLQQAHADESDLPGVRIGIHLGEVTESVGPDNTVRIEGLAVDVAARVSGLAKPGQVLMSSAVYDSARQRMGVEAMGMPLLWQLHGTYALKGFDKPLEIGEAGIKGVAPLEAPKAGDKAQLVRKAKKQPQQFKQSTSRGVPVWAFGVVVMALMGVIVYLFLGRPPAPTGSTPGDAPIRSLAVLPFENLMGDETKEYFVDGMTDTLTAELSKIRSIKVIARTSAMKFKDSDESLSEIARLLGVDGLIEGSVQQFGDEIRITAQLIDGRSEVHLWGDNFEGTLAGVMKMQGEVAVAIADQIGAVLTPEEREDYASAKDVNPEAYDLYLQGRNIMQGRTNDDLRDALNVFERALSLDPEFALPHAGMADVYSLLPLYPSFSFATLGEAAEKAFEHARKAVELDASLADAHVSLGWALTQFDVDRNWAMAEREFRRAIELNPGLARARFRYGWLLISLGRNSDGVREMRLALELNPLDPIAVITLGYALRYSGQHDAAVEAFLRAIEMDPSLIASHSQLYLLYSDLGRFEEALKYAQNVSDIAPSPNSEWRVIFSSAVLKGREALLALVAEVEQGEHDARLLDAGLLDDRVQLYFAVGDTLEALKHAEKDIRAGDRSAMDTRSLQRIEFFESDPAKRRSLDDDPRFWEMLDKYDLPPLPPEHPSYAKEQAYLRQKAAEAALAAQPKPVRRYAIDLGTEYPLAPESGFRDEVLAVSPDGARLVYVSAGVDLDSGLAVRERDRLEVRPISGTSGASHPFFSPDGTRVGFYADNEWRWIPVDGGPSTKIKDSSFPTGAAWADDGTIVIGGGLSEGLQRYSDSGERLEEVTTLVASAGDAVHAMPHPLPDGAGILYTVSTTPGIEGTRVEALSFETGEITIIARQASIPSYTESGHILYVTSGALMAVRFSLDSFAVSGSPVRVSELNMASSTSIPSAYAIARDGTLWYGTEGQSGGLVQFTWLDFDGVEHPTAAEPRPHAPIPALSPDGTKLAIDDGRNIYTIDLVGGMTNRLTFGEFTERWPMWGPNGEEIYYVAYGSNIGLTKRRANGMGTPEQVTTSMGTFVPINWSPDGTQILGLQLTTGASMDIGVLTLGEPSTLETLIGGPGQQSHPDLSPDGKWLAYDSNESGASQVYVRPYPSLDGKWQVSEGGGLMPQWAPDGSTLYYVTGGSVLAVPVALEPTFAFQRAEIVIEHPQLNAFMNPLLSPDGTRFLLQKPIRSESASRKMIVVENFFEVLNRIAPHPDVK